MLLTCTSLAHTTRRTALSNIAQRAALMAHNDRRGRGEGLNTAPLQRDIAVAVLLKPLERRQVLIDRQLVHQLLVPCVP